jgi:hypothetical protein
MDPDYEHGKPNEFPKFRSLDAIDEPWKVEDRGEKPAIALKGR